MTTFSKLCNFTIDKDLIQTQDVLSVMLNHDYVNLIGFEVLPGDWWTTLLGVSEWVVKTWSWD